MAFMISKSHPSFPEAEEAVSLSNGGGNKGEAISSVTSHLYLKSSPTKTRSSSEPLDKEVVLRRIRHHKYLNKIKSTFQALSSSSEQEDKDKATAGQKWLELDDAFTSP